MTGLLQCLVLGFTAILEVAFLLFAVDIVLLLKRFLKVLCEQKDERR